MPRARSTWKGSCARSWSSAALFRFNRCSRLLSGKDDAVRTLNVTPGTLNVFKGRNTLHRVCPPSGSKDRIIAILSYYERAGVVFSAEERLGFYGRAD